MLSVIVPVYNVAATLERCVESICSQSLHYDWELLLIDDGSTDGSGQMCDEMAANNPHIRVFHQANAGLSEARNTGIRNAKGDLITFVDSDDYLLDDVFDSICGEMEFHPEVDIYEYSIERWTQDKQKELIVLDECFYPYGRDYWLGSCGYNHTYACNKVFRRHLFDKVLFQSGRVFEDAWFMSQILTLDVRIVTTCMGGYCYTWNETGITSRASLAQKRQLLEAQLKTVEGLHISFAGKTGKFIRDERVGQLYLYLLNLQITACGGEDKTIILPYYRLPLRRSYSMKALLKILVLNTLGLKFLCKILNYKKIG